MRFGNYLNYFILNLVEFFLISLLVIQLLTAGALSFKNIFEIEIPLKMIEIELNNLINGFLRLCNNYSNNWTTLKFTGPLKLTKNGPL